MASNTETVENSGAADAAECSLPRGSQTRNLFIYAAIWALIYLASPVTYVGVFQATLVDKLHFDAKQANLPAGVYLWTAPLSVMLLCRFPQTCMLRPLIVGAFVAAALAGAAVVAALFSPNPNVLFATLIAYAVMWGCGNGLIAGCQWEMIGRGVTASRRGEALAWAFGVGPVFAVIASLLSQSVMGGDKAGFSLPFVPKLEFPWDFAVLYGASVPIMLLCALLSSCYVVPKPAVEPPRPPWLASVFGGFGDFLRNRLLLVGALAYVLVYSGHEVVQNLSLYTKLVLGGEATDYAGLQMALRFGVKIFAGFGLAWLLVKTNPRALLILTAMLTMSAVLWTLAFPTLYLATFGILGAGELFGVYYLNYIERCSAPAKIRRNIGFASMATMLVGFAPVMYGAISDTFAHQDNVLAGAHITSQSASAHILASACPAWTQELGAVGSLASPEFTKGKRFGFQMSFVASITVLIATIILILVCLPRQPKPRKDDS